MGPTTYKEAKAIAEAQDAYDKWNTAPAWNRAHELRRQEMPAWKRVVEDVLGKIGFALLALIAYSPFYVPVVMYFMQR